MLAPNGPDLPPPIYVPPTAFASDGEPPDPSLSSPYLSPAPPWPIALPPSQPTPISGFHGSDLTEFERLHGFAITPSLWTQQQWLDYNGFREIVHTAVRRRFSGSTVMEFADLHAVQGRIMERRRNYLGFPSWLALLRSMPDLVAIEITEPAVARWVLRPRTLPLPPATLPVPPEVLQRRVGAVSPGVQAFEGPIFYPEHQDWAPFPVPDHAVDKETRVGLSPRLRIRAGYEAFRRIIAELMRDFPNGIKLTLVKVYSGILCKRISKPYRRYRILRFREFLLGMPDLVELRGTSANIVVYPRLHDNLDQDTVRRNEHVFMDSRFPKAAVTDVFEDHDASSSTDVSADLQNRQEDDEDYANDDNKEEETDIEEEGEEEEWDWENSAATVGSDAQRGGGVGEDAEEHFQGDGVGPLLGWRAGIQAEDDRRWASENALLAEQRWLRRRSAPSHKQLRITDGFEDPDSEKDRSLPVSSILWRGPGDEDGHLPALCYVPEPELEGLRVPIDYMRQPPLPVLGPLPALSYFWLDREERVYIFLRDLACRYVLINQKKGLRMQILAGLPGFRGEEPTTIRRSMGFFTLWRFVQSMPDVITIRRVEPGFGERAYRLFPTHPIPDLQYVPPPPTPPAWMRVKFWNWKTWLHSKGFQPFPDVYAPRESADQMLYELQKRARVVANRFPDGLLLEDFVEETRFREVPHADRLFLLKTPSPEAFLETIPDVVRLESLKDADSTVVYPAFEATSQRPSSPVSRLAKHRAHLNRMEALDPVNRASALDRARLPAPTRPREVEPRDPEVWNPDWQTTGDPSSTSGRQRSSSFTDREPAYLSGWAGLEIRKPSERRGDEPCEPRAWENHDWTNGPPLRRTRPMPFGLVQGLESLIYLEDDAVGQPMTEDLPPPPPPPQYPRLAPPRRSSLPTLRCQCACHPRRAPPGAAAACVVS